MSPRLHGLLRGNVSAQVPFGVSINCATCCGGQQHLCANKNAGAWAVQYWGWTDPTAAANFLNAVDYKSIVSSYILSSWSTLAECQITGVPASLERTGVEPCELWIYNYKNDGIVYNGWTILPGIITIGLHVGNFPITPFAHCYPYDAVMSAIDFDSNLVATMAQRGWWYSNTGESFCMYGTTPSSGGGLAYLCQGVTGSVPVDVTISAYMIYYAATYNSSCIMTIVPRASDGTPCRSSPACPSAVGDQWDVDP